MQLSLQDTAWGNEQDLDEVAHYEPPLEDLFFLQIQLFSSGT